MRRVTFNAVWDGSLLALIAGLLSTGLILEFILPPGSGHARTGGSRSVTLLLGLDRHKWGDIHFWIACALLAAVLVHLWLHWRWIWTQVGGDPHRLTPGQRRTRLTVSLVLAVFFFAVVTLPWMLDTQTPPPAETSRPGRGLMERMGQP